MKWNFYLLSHEWINSEVRKETPTPNRKGAQFGRTVEPRGSLQFTAEQCVQILCNCRLFVSFDRVLRVNKIETVFKKSHILYVCICVYVYETLSASCTNAMLSFKPRT